MPDIVISEFMDQLAVDALSDRYQVAYETDLCEREDDLKLALSSASALIVRNRTQVGAEILDAAPGLRCVGRLGVGLDNIDVDACKARGIAVYPATGANDLAVAEYVLTAAMILLRSSWLATAAVAAGTWPRQSMMGRELAGKVMGLVGYGAIARQVAARAVALGMSCVAHDPFVPDGDTAWGTTAPLPLAELLARADVVSLHVPLSSSTGHMLNASSFSAMKAGAIVINAARGGVVDEDALIASLKSGHLGGAALDVFEVEPLSAQRGAAFAGIDNLLLTPHIAGVTIESNARVSALIADRVREHLQGVV